MSEGEDHQQQLERQQILQDAIKNAMVGSQGSLEDWLIIMSECGININGELNEPDCKRKKGR